MTDTYGSFAAASCASAELVFAICSNEYSPSCMRAPPLAEKQTSGRWCWMQYATARTNRSPTTEPIEPEMNRNSKAAATIGIPFSVPAMTTSASRSSVSRCTWFSRSR